MLKTIFQTRRLEEVIKTRFESNKTKLEVIIKRIDTFFEQLESAMESSQDPQCDSHVTLRSEVSLEKSLNFTSRYFIAFICLFQFSSLVILMTNWTKTAVVEAGLVDRFKGGRKGNILDEFTKDYETIKEKVGDLTSRKFNENCNLEIRQTKNKQITTFFF